MACLAWRTASGPLAAMRRAISSVVSRRLSGSTTRLTSPHASASSAVKGMPDRISSLARRSPTARARFWVPPAQINRERFEQLHEIEPHARVQRVGQLGPTERDQQDVIVVTGNDNRLKIGTHRMLLRSRAGLARPELARPQIARPMLARPG